MFNGDQKVILTLPDGSEYEAVISEFFGELEPSLN